MKQNIKQNTPVLTADEYLLGQAHTLYHRHEPAEPELSLFATYLMVVNMTIGDEFYVPTTYLDEAREGGGTAVYLSLTRADIQEQQLTRTPQFIVDHQFNEEKLAPADNSAAAIPTQGQPIDDIVPLPPNLQTDPQDKPNPP